MENYHFTFLYGAYYYLEQALLTHENGLEPTLLEEYLNINLEQELNKEVTRYWKIKCLSH